MYNRRKCACANLFNLESSNTCGCDNMSARNRRSCDCDNITSRNRNTCDCDRARTTCGCDNASERSRRLCNSCGIFGRNRRSCDCDSPTSRNRNTCDCDRARSSCDCDNASTRGRSSCDCDRTPSCDRRSCGCGHESEHSDDNSCGCDDEHGREHGHGIPCGCDELFEELTRVSFALDELRLYLDMHPCCTEALEQFCELQKKREAILADYTENCRSVNSYAVNTSDGWSWTDAPMPWKGGKK